MAQKPALSEQHFLDAIKSRSAKDYKVYIDEIDQQSPEAEQAVNIILTDILVKKKYKDPTIMLNALVFYKQLLIGATLDYICQNDFFNSAIHLQISKACEYNGADKNIRRTYLIDTLQLQKNQNNETMGYNYVLISLELIKSMAKWCPNDYQHRKNKSIFKQIYDKLIEKKVYFPQQQNFQRVRKTDEENFKKNYQQFISYQAQEPENKDKKQSPPKPGNPAVQRPASEVPSIKGSAMQSKPPNTSLNIPAKNENTKASEMHVINSNVLQSKLPNTSLNIPAKKENTKAPEMHVINSNILESKIVPKPGKAEPNKTLTISNAPQSKVSTGSVNLAQKIAKTGQPTQINKSNLAEIKPPIAPASTISQKSNKAGEEMAVIKSAALESRVSQHPVNNTLNIPTGSTFPIDQQKLKQMLAAQAANSSAIPVKKQLSMIRLGQKPPESLVDNTNAQSSRQKKQKNVSKQQQDIRNTSGFIMPQQQSLNRTTKITQSQEGQYIIRNINLNSTSTKPLQTTQAIDPKLPNSKHINKEEISNNQDLLGSKTPFSFNQKNSRLQKESPMKVHKIQKPIKYQSLQLSPQNVKQIQPQTPCNPNSASRPKSLPKTQKKYLGNHPFALHRNRPPNPNPFELSPPNIKDNFSKTLSQFMNSQKKWAANSPQKDNKTLKIVQKMRLDRTTIAVLPHYYHPVTPDMQNLRQQALNIYGSGSSYSPFYSDAGIEARLIKQKNNQFFLSIHNTSSTVLNVEYPPQQNKHSVKIKILTWNNKQQAQPCLIASKSYLDIKFHFQTYDLNFKFLNMLLKVNGKLLAIVLPITLLDMCELNPQINAGNLQQYKLKGSIVCSEAFTLRDDQIPQFLGGLKTKTNAYSKDSEILLGQCGITFKKQSYYNKGYHYVPLLVRLIDSSKKSIELDLLHITKDLQSQNLAKVLLYLLVFLLHQQ